MANQVISAGQAIAVPAAQTQVVARSGQMLGFWANATTTVVINDAASTAQAGAANQKLNATACNVGWNPFPLEFNQGLNITPGAAIVVILN